MTDRLKQIVEKYTLKETDGFEGKKDKETNVEEDLRKNYETSKMVPYQSVIAEGKIIVSKKKKIKEGNGIGSAEDCINEIKKVGNSIGNTDYESFSDEEKSEIYDALTFLESEIKNCKNRLY
jgi:hypothetical protein